jgi:hypothetical protein
METVQFISTSPKALANLISDAVKLQLEDLKKNFEPKIPTEFLTRNEVKDLLKVDLSTVHNLTKRNVLVKYGCGGRVYYKRSEVEQAIEKINN